MPIVVRWFASYADLVGAKKTEVPLEPPTTVAELRLVLAKMYPELPQQLLIAVNSEYASDHHMITPSDEIAVVPPAAGG